MNTPVRDPAGRLGPTSAARPFKASLAWGVVAAAVRPAAAADSCQIFADPFATPPVMTVHNVIGTYRRVPAENGWHTGSLALAPGPGERRSRDIDAAEDARIACLVRRPPAGDRHPIAGGLRS